MENHVPFRPFKISLMPCVVACAHSSYTKTKAEESRSEGQLGLHLKDGGGVSMVAHIYNSST